MRTVYVTIGNSDDKLTQRLWSKFWNAVDDQVREYSFHIHGAWLSEPSSEYQNACWCFVIEDDSDGEDCYDDLRARLRVLAQHYGQDSILWAEAREVEHLGPKP